MENTDCLFCRIVRDDSLGRIIEENSDGFLMEDGYSLVIPKRHVESIFDTTPEEKASLFLLVERAKGILDKKYQPSAYNIGINDGSAAGQTVPHLHIHLIPRYEETGSDPRGGVRWIIPEKADYWGDK